MKWSRGAVFVGVCQGGGFLISFDRDPGCVSFPMSSTE